MLYSTSDGFTFVLHGTPRPVTQPFNATCAVIATIVAVDVFCSSQGGVSTQTSLGCMPEIPCHFWFFPPPGPCVLKLRMARSGA